MAWTSVNTTQALSNFYDWSMSRSKGHEDITRAISEGYLIVERVTRTLKVAKITDKGRELFTSPEIHVRIHYVKRKAYIASNKPKLLERLRQKEELS